MTVGRRVEEDAFEKTIFQGAPGSGMLKCLVWQAAGKQRKSLRRFPWEVGAISWFG
jgi:hypothetical protein